jgi:hypothetical protein
MRPAAGDSNADGAEQAHAAIQRFLASARQPVLLEPGDEKIPLTDDSHSIEYQKPRLTLQAWTRDRNIVRRVLGVAGEKPGRLDLIIEKFGKKTGTLQLIDTGKPQAHTAVRRASRLTYREQFRRSLSRSFPGWTVAEVSAEADLEHSLSPAFPRGLVKKGPSGWAAIGAPPEGNVEAVLTFGLIWLEYVRRREKKIRVEGLAIFVPEGHERTTCLRVLHLDQARAHYAVYAYSEAHEQRLDVRDYGNIDTKLTPRNATPWGAMPEWIGPLSRSAEVEAVELGDGGTSLRVRGLEFARVDQGRVRFGLETRRTATESNLPEIEALAWELARIRSAHALDRLNPLFQKGPELWLESQIRANLPELDASLERNPVYGQVPAFAAGDRGVIDLLAVDSAGRLSVIEIKAKEDIHLPLQALDYWMRVKWHLDRDEFTPSGYFPGIGLNKLPPRMLLVAPSLEFHPTTETILSYFASDVQAERFGVGMQWQSELKVMFRMKGSAGI